MSFILLYHFPLTKGWFGMLFLNCQARVHYKLLQFCYISFKALTFFVDIKNTFIDISQFKIISADFFPKGLWIINYFRIQFDTFDLKAENLSYLFQIIQIKLLHIFILIWILHFILTLINILSIRWVIKVDFFNSYSNLVYFILIFCQRFRF